MFENWICDFLLENNTRRHWPCMPSKNDRWIWVGEPHELGPQLAHPCHCPTLAVLPLCEPPGFRSIWIWDLFLGTISLYVWWDTESLQACENCLISPGFNLFFKEAPPLLFPVCSFRWQVVLQLFSLLLKNPVVMSHVTLITQQSLQISPLADRAPLFKSAPSSLLVARWDV